MADAVLQSILTHIVNVYHLVQSEDTDGQVLEGYPDRWSPDILNLPCAIVQDGETLAKSAVGAIIGSTMILYCEDADLREHDRVHWKEHVYCVNGTPAKYMNIFDAANANTPHLLEVGLIEERADPA